MLYILQVSSPDRERASARMHRRAFVRRAVERTSVDLVSDWSRVVASPSRLDRLLFLPLVLSSDLPSGIPREYEREGARATYPLYPFPPLLVLLLFFQFVRRQLEIFDHPADRRAT